MHKLSLIIIFLIAFKASRAQLPLIKKETPVLTPKKSTSAKKVTIKRLPMTTGSEQNYLQLTKNELQNLVDDGKFDALYELANRYFQDGDYINALVYFKDAFVKANNYKAAFMASFCYYLGLGTPLNYTETNTWATYAATYNYAPALYRLGSLYNDGLGVSQSFSDANVYFKKAFNIISGKPAAKLDPWEETTMGVLYIRGYFVTKDENQAFKWYQKSAQDGCIIGQYNLGWAYSEGTGTSVDKRAAFEWYTKAAQAGFPMAQNNLGSMYLDGDGVNTDEQLGFNWQMKGAIQGYSMAEFNVGNDYENGFGVEKDISEAIKWYRKATAQGYSPASTRLKLLTK